MALIRDFSFPNELGFRGRGSEARFIPRLGLRDQFKLNQMRQQEMGDVVAPDLGGGLLGGPTGGSSGLGGSLGGQGALDTRLAQALMAGNLRRRRPGVNLGGFFNGMGVGGFF